MAAERSIFFAGDWGSDADEREPHAAALAGAPDGGFRRAHGSAEPQLVPELFAERSGPRADAKYSAVAGDFADRSRPGIGAQSGRTADGAVSGAVGAVAAAHRAAERCGH